LTTSKIAKQIKIIIKYKIGAKINSKSIGALVNPQNIKMGCRK
jgi:hypothetical protein